MTPLTNLPKKKEIRKVEIDWIDSCSDEGWQWIGEYTKNYKEEHFKTVSFLLEKTKKSYILSASLHANLNGEWIKGNGFFSIPIGCVIKVKYL